MTAHRLLVIARRFRGPPTSGNRGYTCGMLAAAAPKPVEVRFVRPPPLDRRLEIVDDPATGGLKLVDGVDTIATATPKSFELDVPRPPSYAQALAAVGNYEGFQEHAYSNCFVCGPLLGTYAARIDRCVHLDASCVVIGWALKHEGRKHVVGTAIFDHSGELCGRALATWVEPRPAA
ncbi:MAG: hypothetical protein FJ171_07090 [Gammaproteobacteria bacterium]|nr:hypothetical protein [Gammaproteobacteria bacterium]